MKDKFIHIKVTEDYKDRIRKAAEYSNVSISAFVVEAINKELKRTGK